MLRNYVTLALKVLARRKFFTFVSLFGISFTLMVLMLATALLDHVLAPAPPESRQSRMLANHNAMMFSRDGGNQWSSPAGFRLFDQYARDLPGVERLSIYAGSESVASFLNGQKVVSELKRTDAQYWQILDFTFLEGGPYSENDVEAARAVAVVNDATRRRFFGGRPAVGRVLEAGGQRFTVVGVVEDVSSLRAAPSGDIWAPLTTAKSDAYRREIMGNHHALVLARDRSWLPRIREEFNERLTRVELPDARNYDTIVAPLEGKLDSFARQSPFVDRGNPERQGWKIAVALVIGALLFALLPTVNLINLNVSRILERASEIGVRKAFGASSRALLWQFVVENVILTLAGGALGLVLAGALLRAFNASGMFQYAALTLNVRIFLYGLCLALAFGVLSGVYPAWRMSRLHPAEALKGNSR